MRQVGKLHSALDEEILDRLFTMFDLTGDDRIDPLPLLIGISPLALIGDDKEKLIFAMEVCDVNGTGLLRVMEVFKIFQSINNTVSYLGDPVLSMSEVEQLTSDVFGDDPIIHYYERIDDLANHPLYQKFVCGMGSCRFRL
eukprot:CAMPEP_0116025034 /NCGR_PEP_ID=MMETSP0321-20121206/12748_1 /TAXON_ID=163516 /ORGANISM="Leptocylindrus danicus var. danicus, Strain B650" /LENGTH=140 /DNA_ID=CAMNT_0003497031 /DNA_START=93 /DNA_END=515 /DNA_ORIENTATION=-